MKRRILLLLPLLLILVLTLPVLAEGLYRAEIVIEDTSDVDREGLGVLIPFNTQSAIDMGFLEADGLDSRFLEGTTERYYMVADDKLGLFIPELLASQEREYRFETGWTPELTDLGVITGPGGCITVSDDADLELGDDFAIELDGYIDVSSTQECFPVVEGRANSEESTGETSHDVSLPSNIVVGEVLFFVFFGDSGGGSPNVASWPPSGWTALFSDGDGTTDSCIGAAYKVASGSEGSTVTVNTDSSCSSIHQSYRISRATSVEGREVGHYDSDATPDPPDLTSSWGTSRDTLWIAGFVGDAAAVRSITDDPADYGAQYFQSVGSTYDHIATTTRYLTAASEDPGVYTLDDIISGWWFTLGIQGTYNTQIVIKEDACFIDNTASGEITATIDCGYNYYYEGDYDEDWEAGASSGTGSQSPQSDHLYLYASDTGVAERTYVTSIQYDLTDVDTLFVRWLNSGAGSGDVESYLIVDGDQGGNRDNHDAFIIKYSSFTIVTSPLDVSSISGNKYIRVHAVEDDFSNPDVSELEVYRIYTDTGIEIELTATGLSSEEQKVELYVDSDTLKLDIEDINKDSHSGFSRYRGVEDTSSDWIINLDFLDYCEITVDGNLVVDYDPTHLIEGTVLPSNIGHVANPSFETGDPPDDWSSVRCTISSEGTIVQHGSSSLKLVSTTEDGYYSYSLQNIQDDLGIDFWRGRTVTMGVWARASSSNTYESGFAINDDSYAWSSDVPKDDTWHWMTVTSTIKESATLVRPFFSCRKSSNGEAGETAYFDGLVWYLGDSIPGSLISDPSVGEVEHNGVITWGSNSDLAITVGGLQSITSYTSESGTNATIPDVSPDLPDLELFPADEAVTGLPWYDLVNPAAIGLEWSTNTLYSILYIFIAIGIGVGVMIATGSALLGAIATGAGLAVAAGTGVTGWWIVLVYAIFASGYLVVVRSI